MIRLNEIGKTFYFPTANSNHGLIRDLAPIGLKKLVALRDITMTINQGEFVLLTGPNGSGKSTLLKIMAGDLKPSHGKVWLESSPLAFLYPPTGLEAYLSLKDFLFRKGLTPPQAEEILEFSGLNQLSGMLVSGLSLGMKSKLIASLLLKKKTGKIILLDDIFLTADSAFQARFFEAAKGKTLLLASHSPRRAKKFMKRIIYLNHGLIINDEKNKEK